MQVLFFELNSLWVFRHNQTGNNVKLLECCNNRHNPIVALFCFCRFSK